MTFYSLSSSDDDVTVRHTDNCFYSFINENVNALSTHAQRKPHGRIFNYNIIKHKHACMYQCTHTGTHVHIHMQFTHKQHHA